jgi:DNA-directed RNA polymerase subunit RPC12/RpoP
MALAAVFDVGVSCILATLGASIHRRLDTGEQQVWLTGRSITHCGSENWRLLQQFDTLTLHTQDGCGSAMEQHIVFHPIICPHCGKKQEVKTRVSHNATTSGAQPVSCLECGESFNVQVPDLINGGPYHLLESRRRVE